MISKQLLYAILRQDFKSFVIKVFKEVSPNDNYMDNWHIDVVCQSIMDMVHNKNTRLIINIPPRYMKSIICSVALPAYLLGLNPKINIICVSYSDDLASKFANDCRNILQTSWYKEIFPHTILSPSRKAVNDFETTAGGGRMATSIGGTLTGRGADWIIIDDPLKPTEAMSDTQREKVNDWYGSTLYSRLNDKSHGKILLIMQRLHQNDLTGFLLTSKTPFKHIKLPIIAEEDEQWIINNHNSENQRIIFRAKGELLHPHRENIDVISDLRKNLGEYGFAGQYQQRPTPIEGGLIKEKWLHFYNIKPNKFKNIILSWDTAEKVGEKNAFSACITMRIDENKKIYILDCYRERLEFPSLIRKIEQKHYEALQNYTNAKIETLIEDASSGVQAIQQLKTKNREFKIIPIKPVVDKISRLEGVSPYIEDGSCLFPALVSSWWKDFKDELLMFPNSVFKDQCDALSQGIDYCATNLIAKTKFYWSCIV